jgi:hypothetical protein
MKARVRVRLPSCSECTVPRSVGWYPSGGYWLRAFAALDGWTDPFDLFSESYYPLEPQRMQLRGRWSADIELVYETEPVDASLRALMPGRALLRFARGSVDVTLPSVGRSAYFALWATTSPAVIWGGFGSNEASFSRTKSAALLFDSSAPD